MKGVVLIVLFIISLFQRSTVAGPMDRLLLTLQPEIQTEAVESGPLDETLNAIVQSLRLRLKRETSVASKTPGRICTGCFSVIGDPTKPQK